MDNPKTDISAITHGGGANHIGGRKPPWILVGLFAASLLLMALAVKAGVFVPMDRAVAQGVETIRTLWLDEGARAITFFGSTVWTLSAMVLMSAWKRRERGRVPVFWGAWLFGCAVQVLLRLWVAQGRPDAAVVPVGWAADFLELGTQFHLAGFPSGHAFRSAFLFGWWAQGCLRRQGLWERGIGVGCLVVIVLVGWTRLYLNRHWLTDVLGSWVLALLSLTLACALRPRQSAPSP